MVDFFDKINVRWLSHIYGQISFKHIAMVDATELLGASSNDLDFHFQFIEKAQISCFIPLKFLYLFVFNVVY